MTLLLYNWVTVLLRYCVTVLLCFSVSRRLAVPLLPRGVECTCHNYAFLKPAYERDQLEVQFPAEQKWLEAYFPASRLAVCLPCVVQHEYGFPCLVVPLLPRVRVNARATLCILVGLH